MLAILAVVLFFLATLAAFGFVAIAPLGLLALGLAFLALHSVVPVTLPAFHRG